MAGGQIPNHPGAVRMGTVQWDNKLAHLASLHVKSCKDPTNECRNIDEFLVVGQNVAENWWTQNKQRLVDEVLREQIKSWFDEHQLSRESLIRRVQNPTNATAPNSGNFLVMINQNSVKVGCAAVSYTMRDRKTKLPMTHMVTACDYSHDMIIGTKVYEIGDTASKCETGTNPKYSNLCSTSEYFDVNFPLIA